MAPEGSSASNIFLALGTLPTWLSPSRGLCRSPIPSKVQARLVPEALPDLQIECPVQGSGLWILCLFLTVP